MTSFRTALSRVGTAAFAVAAGVVAAGAAIAQPVPAASAAAASASAASAATGTVPLPVVDINTASEALLIALKGINKARAQMIADGRPYERVDELLGKRILPRPVFDAIKEQLTVKPASAPPVRH